MAKLILPYPPSVNHYWRNAGRKVVRTQTAIDYRNTVRWLCLAAQLVPVAGKVCVFVDLYRPVKRGDLDNCLKATLDSLIGFAYEDDQQIVEIHALLHDDKLDPRVEVVVTEVG